MIRFCLRLMIGVYRYVISPLFPGHCRFYPTCSAYASEVVQRYGAIAGGQLTLKRLGRCHPLGDSGVDPVPELSGEQGNKDMEKS